MYNPQHDPYAVKLKAVADTLNLRRRDARDVSIKVNEDRTAYFEKLALLNAGALTFSATLLSPSSPLAPTSTSILFILYSAWVFLLLALSACLIRNFSHQHFHYFDAFADRVQAEIDYLETDIEVIKAKSALPEGMAYADSPESYNAEREVQVRQESAARWSERLKEIKPQINWSWKINKVSEWVAAITMALGFLCLILFAILKTYR